MELLVLFVGSAIAQVAWRIGIGVEAARRRRAEKRVEKPGGGPYRQLFMMENEAAVFVGLDPAIKAIRFTLSGPSREYVHDLLRCARCPHCTDCHTVMASMAGEPGVFVNARLACQVRGCNCQAFRIAPIDDPGGAST